MIDDEFEQMFRQLIEQFFGRSFGIGGNNSFQMRMSTSPDMNVPRFENEELRDKKAEIEKIEFEDRLVVIVDNFAFNHPPAIYTDGMTLIVKSIDEREITIELPYAIDVEQSNMSFRNGVVEIVLFRTEKLRTKESDEFHILKMI